MCATVALTTCGSSNAPSGAGATVPIQRHPSPTAHLVSGASAPIAVMLMENEEYGGIIGSPSAPYINSLARRYALATGMYAITHPSLPNYLAVTGGSTFGIDSDCTGCTVGATSIVDQLERARLSWRAYMQDLPRGAGGAGGDLLYGRERGRVRQEARPVRVLHADHRQSPALREHRLAHEGSSDSGCGRLASGGHIVTILAGSGARAGARLAEPTDHYSVLQTIEDLLGLARLRGAACACTPSLQPLLAKPRG